MKLVYKELGLELVEPLKDQPRKPQQPPMEKQKKDEGAGDPFKILLEEALERQRNAMLDNFAQILNQMLTCDAYSYGNHTGGITPFKVQLNFDIPIFECQIDVDIVDRCFHLVE